MRKYSGNHIILSLLILVCSMVITSCSNDDYLHAVPEGCTAIISVDIPRVAENKKGVDANIIKTLFHLSDASKCGIDMTSKVYLFEDPDGNLGLAAKVKDADDFANQLTNLAKKGKCQKVQKKRGKYFTVLNRTWLIGFNDDALLVMGPSVGSVAQAGLMRTMMKLLDAERGIEESPLYARLQDIESPIAMVAQTQALPEQFSALFTLGAPRDVSPSDVLIAASLDARDGCLEMSSKVFSFDETIDKSLKESEASFRPLQADYVRQIPDSSFFSIAMNIEGKSLLKMMKDNKTLRAMLTGMSLSVDADEFVSSVNGNFVMVMPSFDKENISVLWNADLSQSVNNFDTTGDLLKHRLSNEGQKLPAHVVNKSIGKLQYSVINLNAVDSSKREIANALSSLMTPMFGNVTYIVCSTTFSNDKR